MARFCRDVPDNDVLAVGRGQKMLFSFRKAGSGRRRPHRLRYRKDERPLQEKDRTEEKAHQHSGSK